MSETFLSRRKIAARGGFSPNTLKNYAESGTGPAFVKVGNGSCRYSVSAFDAWLAANTFGSAQ